MTPPPWPLAVVVGPSASGKSAAAMTLGYSDPVEIVSCDSLQVYQGLDVGSAKPSLVDRSRVPHHLLDVAEPHELFSAARYSELGRLALQGIHERGHLPLIVGGSGLYLRALLFGLFPGPARDEPLRRRLEAFAQRRGDTALHALLGRVDPSAAERIHPRDRVRSVRALEVYRLTRRRFSAQLEEPTPPLGSPFEIAIFGLNPSRGELRARIEARTEAMFAGGLLDEARELLERYSDPLPRPLDAIGYREAVQVVRGACAPDEARRLVVIRTMQYAKRQMTWFRHQARVDWFWDGEALVSAVRRFWSRSRGTGGAPSA